MHSASAALVQAGRMCYNGMNSFQEEIAMLRKIASFTINHDTLTPGMYAFLLCRNAVKSPVI